MGNPDQRKIILDQASEKLKLFAIIYIQTGVSDMKVKTLLGAIVMGLSQ